MIVLHTPPQYQRVAFAELVRHTDVILVLSAYLFALLATAFGYDISFLHCIIKFDWLDVSSVLLHPSVLGVRNILRHIVASVGFSIRALSVRIS